MDGSPRVNIRHAEGRSHARHNPEDSWNDHGHTHYYAGVSRIDEEGNDSAHGEETGRMGRAAENDHSHVGENGLSVGSGIWVASDISEASAHDSGGENALGSLDRSLHGPVVANANALDYQDGCSLSLCGQNLGNGNKWARHDLTDNLWPSALLSHS